MRKFVVVMMVLALMLSAGTALAAEQLLVGMECDYAPFNWIQMNETETAVPVESGGYADGYDVQIARKIAEGMGLELVIMKIEWDGLIPAVQTGAIDAIIAGMSPTAERSMTIDFSEPYYESDLVVVVKADGPYAGAVELADLSGAAITAQLNTFHYSVIRQIPGVLPQNAMESFPAMIVALKAGAIDGYVSERPGAVSAVASNPELTFISFPERSGFIASPEDVAISVGLAKDSPIKAQMDEVIAGISREERNQMMDDAVTRQP